MNELEGMINKVLSNPDEMKKLMDMAGTLMAGQGGATSEAAPPPSPAAQTSGASAPDMSELLRGVSSLPPEMLAGAMKLIQGFGEGQNSEKHALLGAMKPYLSETRRGKLDRAMQLARVLNIGLGLFGKNGGLL